MKKKSLLSLIMFALCCAATAAEPAAPVVGVEPQPVGQTASGATPGSPPPGAGLDDFGFAHSSAHPSGPADPAARDDEYRSAAQPMPALEGF
jgi:hypothetical protein